MSPATETLIKMVEDLPLSLQEQIVVQVKHYLAEIQAENHWQNLYQQTESQLARVGCISVASYTISWLKVDGG